MECTCHEILREGTGPLGESVEVLGVHTAEDAAREAASYFDEGWLQQPGTDLSECHGGQRWIQVDWPTGSQRFEVFCTVQRKYDATELIGNG